MKTMVILNPAADRGHAAELAAPIQAKLRAATTFDWVETNGPAHAIELAEDAARAGYETIVAAGGDGTVHEVVNGILRASADEGTSARLGLIPIGSGNDFAWMTGALLNDPQQAAQRVTTGQTRRVDAGWVRDERGDAQRRYFANGVGIGFDAVVAIESRKLKRLRGFMIYAVAVLQTMRFYYRAIQTALDNDGHKIELPLLMASIANGRRYGGGFYVCPQASIDDGHFDVCLVPQVSRAAMLALIPRFMRGTHVTDRRVTMRRASRVSLQCETPIAIHADGEIFSTGSRQIEMAILPEALSVIV